jgi:uncharacterized protein YjbI with pentapeptide repeats
LDNATFAAARYQIAFGGTDEIEDSSDPEGGCGYCTYFEVETEQDDLVFEDQHFINCDLSGVNFHNSQFINTTFTGCNVEDCQINLNNMDDTSRQSFMNNQKSQCLPVLNAPERILLDASQRGLVRNIDTYEDILHNANTLFKSENNDLKAQWKGK